MPTDLRFEDEAVRKDRASALQEVGQAVRSLCSLTSDPRTVRSSAIQHDPRPPTLGSDK